MNRNVREMQLSEVHHVISYFLNADHQFLSQLGIDPEKLPEYDQWFHIIRTEFERPKEERQLFYLTWEVEAQPVGHSHINDIDYGNQAYMHLHIWNPSKRKTGNGTYFVRESVRHYFEKLELKRLYCQPYARNPAPNRTLEKAGFTFLKTYETIPSWINFHQAVNLWVMERTTLDTLK